MKFIALISAAAALAVESQATTSSEFDPQLSYEMRQHRHDKNYDHTFNAMKCGNEGQWCSCPYGYIHYGAKDKKGYLDKK